LYSKDQEDIGDMTVLLLFAFWGDTVIDNKIVIFITIGVVCFFCMWKMGTGIRFN
jgi:hypothetical protein